MLLQIQTNVVGGHIQGEVIFRGGLRNVMCDKEAIKIAVTVNYGCLL